MIPTIIAFVAAISILVVSLFYYAVGLTRREAYVRLLSCSDSLNASGIIWVMNGEGYEQFASDPGNRRRFALEVLPLLAADVRACLQGATRPSHFALAGLFYFLLGMVWAKSRLLPGPDDLRALMGVQALLVRQSSPR